ncbi:DUF2255 family protein [uncultured Pseudokineococcus sp.]|uniref:DUF2255 family protein n=1 Tax=uncultured Pseudokineococcus sp. TaxID=1642928 RepID=UPI0026380DD2|nr:DUF2255 family protein [uncultured Pseudokineococcus sp.]
MTEGSSPGQDPEGQPVEGAGRPAALPWAPEQLERLDVARELRIAVPRGDEEPAPGTPVWVVRVGDEVFVRSWHRRSTGWFGRAVARGRARVHVPGVEADVVVVDLTASPAPGGGASPPLEELLDDVDAAYRAKYGAGGGTAGMVTEEARATTLRLDRLPVRREATRPDA